MGLFFISGKGMSLTGFLHQRSSFAKLLLQKLQNEDAEDINANDIKAKNIKAKSINTKRIHGHHIFF